MLLRKMITGTNTKKLSMHLTGPTVAGSHMEVYRFRIKFSTLEANMKVVALKTNDNFLLMTM